MELVEVKDNLLTSVFSASIREDRLITIPCELREYFKNSYNIELDVGKMLQIAIKNGTKISSPFPKEITTGYRIRIPDEVIKFYGFKIGEIVEVEIIIDKDKY